MTDRMRPSSRPTSFRPSLICIALAAALQAGAAWAVEPFVLKDIRVEGLQRSDAGTVFAALPFRIGETYSDEKGAAAMRALFATGLYKDVRIDIDGSVVVIIVEERPVIANIDFVGLKEFDKEQLTKALKDFGISDGQPFDKALADRAEQELKRQYLTRSLYGAEVVTTVTPQERNRVNLSFTVTEGTAAKISEIRINGSRAFSESTLKGLFDLNDGSWLNFYTKADRYSRAKLDADLETLRAYYLNRGYLEFSVESTQVAISADKQDITVTINVKEGQPFTVTSVKLEGEYLGKEEDFKTLVAIKPGEPYRAETVTQTTRLIMDRFGTFGYAFARVEARPEIDRDNSTVAITIVAEPSRRVYVRRINVAGNTKTRDEVVRREFRQFESSWYDGRKIKLSRDRIDRLGYFSEVNVDSAEVPGSGDQVDLTLTIKEKATGNLQLGAGFSSADSLSLSGSIKQENIFGSGNYLGIEVNTSKYTRTLVLSTVDPYYTVDGISRFIDIFYRTQQPTDTQGGSYTLVTPGASIRFGVPFSEYDTVYFGLGIERTEIEGDNLPLNYRKYVYEFGTNSNAVPLTIGWARDSRDSALVPTAGRLMSVNFDWSLAGEVRYVRTLGKFQQYIPMTKQFTLGLNADVAFGRGLADQPYPTPKNFYSGGLGSVRGFEQNTLGPVDVTGAYIGGNRKLSLNAELYLPVPGTGNDRTLRWFTFMDAGNVWGENDRITIDTLRASAGVGLTWISPVGPLKLSYGAPINKKPQDRIQRLQFQIGTAF
jgi:outer membrane protein insertion porin family